MQYGIGTLRENQRTRLCLIWMNCVRKSQLTIKGWSCDRPVTFDVTWRDMTWCDMTWRGVTWCDMAWHDVIWCDMAWHDVTWRDMTCDDVAWLNKMWRDITWRDMTWNDVAWRGMTWNNMTIKWTINRALVVGLSGDICAIAYKFRAFSSRNECFGKLENLLNWKKTWMFDVPKHSENVSKSFPDLKNIMRDEISKL